MIVRWQSGVFAHVQKEPDVSKTFTQFPKHVLQKYTLALKVVDRGEESEFSVSWVLGVPSITKTNITWILSYHIC